MQNVRYDLPAGKCYTSSNIVTCVWCEAKFPEYSIVEVDENGEDVCPVCKEHGCLMDEVY